MRLPLWCAALAALGWLPGGILFPLGLHFLSDLDQPLSVYGHFLISFTLSGLIALAYSFCGVQYVALRVLYPRLWREMSHFTERARRELQGMPVRHNWIQVLAGSIPLLAAVLTLTLAGENVGFGYRVMVIGLILLGMLGYEVARAATRRLSQTLVALTGTEA